ncbi:CDP-glycerol glycerophosphotransferase family protein [Sphingobium sp. SCG-1]|uniref:CDP-glycerol glycerophosphotransferase family protein n=1 Tax=Sphingobium sp. SCG-1 TaxID=2072936 RepID=UPI001670C50B|nr:CDP-glycerol glycerophosphotransferase family protein [Sphingobium sp. SCG-1]
MSAIARAKTLLRPFKARSRHLVTFLLNVTLYPASGLFPRSPYRWVFGYTGETFADNPKYLYLWMLLFEPRIRVTWITGSKATRNQLRRLGYPVEMRWSLHGMAAVLRAKVIVFSHGMRNVNTFLSKGAVLVNLWHGVGIKSVHLGHKGGNTAAAHRAAGGWIGRVAGIEYLRPYDILVSTSDVMQAHFASQFQMLPERCPQLGYPRLDCTLGSKLREVAEGIDKTSGFTMRPDGFDEVYIYLPTYRDSGRDLFSEALPDLRGLSDALAARNALLYIKPHPRTQYRYGDSVENVRTWPTGIDFNTYLSDFDCLITDYSSVFYDYILHRSAVILYTFDLEEYLSKDRELVMPFKDNVVGIPAFDFQTLCRIIRNGDAFTAQNSEAIARLRAKFWGGSAVPASPAIVDYVMRQLTGRAFAPEDVHALKEAIS